MNTGFNIAPGMLIGQELEARGWTEHELAVFMGQPVQVVRELMIGQRELTFDLAQRVSSALGMSVAVWMNLERGYRERLR